jgi:hypothetical protein
MYNFITVYQAQRSPNFHIIQGPNLYLFISMGGLSKTIVHTRTPSDPFPLPPPPHLHRHSPTPFSLSFSLPLSHALQRAPKKPREPVLTDVLSSLAGGEGHDLYTVMEAKERAYSLTWQGLRSCELLSIRYTSTLITTPGRRSSQPMPFLWSCLPSSLLFCCFSYFSCHSLLTHTQDSLVNFFCSIFGCLHCR